MIEVAKSAVCKNNRQELPITGSCHEHLRDIRNGRRTGTGGGEQRCRTPKAQYHAIQQLAPSHSGDPSNLDWPFTGWLKTAIVLEAGDPVRLPIPAASLVAREVTPAKLRASSLDSTDQDAVGRAWRAKTSYHALTQSTISSIASWSTSRKVGVAGNCSLACCPSAHGSAAQARRAESASVH